MPAPAEPAMERAVTPFEQLAEPEPEAAPPAAVTAPPDADAWESLLASLRLELKSASQT